MNKLIFGKNNLKNIVNITCFDDKVTIYIAEGDGTKSLSFDYIPFALTSDEYEGSTKLNGPGYYRYVTPILDTDYEDVYGRGVYRPRSREEGYMVLNGYTYYKGMKVSDVSLLSFDIEATSLDPKVEHAAVLMISNTFRSRSGKLEKRLFDVKDYSSIAEMLQAWCVWVREVDPDILIGHNIFGYDLPYMAEFGPLNLGRDGSELRFDNKVSKKRKDGQQQYEYYNAHCNGREIVDSMFMSITYDVGRQFPSYGLKRIEKHLGLVGDDRIEWDFNKHDPKDWQNWPDDLWTLFKEYCKDDADSPIAMFDIMAPTLFYLNQSIPKKFQQMVNEATGSQIDSFMIRAYLQDGLALPMTSPSVDFEGAISMGVPGIYDNVRKVDVASLYPSIMRQYQIYPKGKDYKKYFLQTIDYFTEQRLKNKKIAKETNDPYYDSLQNAQKIFINSCYGFMGANYLLFNYPEGAAEVTRQGREILQKGVEWSTGHRLEHVVKKVVNAGKPNEKKTYEWVLGPKISAGKGYDLVNVDTDSFSVTNGTAPTPEEFEEEIKDLNSLYPKLIRWENDGVFDRVIVVAAKNYVMKSGNSVKYKGSSIKDQKKEPILRRMMDELFNSLLSDNDNIERIYESYCRKALEIDNINDWSVKKTVTRSVINETTSGQANINAAIKGRGFSEGDKIWLYVKEDPEKPADVNKKKYALIEDFQGEYHVWHYVKRVYDTLSILENLIDIKQFIKYHNKSNRSKLEELCNESKKEEKQKSAG